jgi:hypothetical protein
MASQLYQPGTQIARLTVDVVQHYLFSRSRRTRRGKASRRLS